MGKLLCACCDKEKDEIDGEYLRYKGEGCEEWICIDCIDNGRVEDEGWE